MKTFILYLAFLTITSTSYCFADSTTTTTTTTNADGSTTVEESTTTTEPSEVTGPKLIGPAGVTGTIRRSDRRQDRRLEEDLEDLGDAIDRRPTTQSRSSVERSPRRGRRR